MVKLTELDESAKMDTSQSSGPHVITLGYIFTEAGREVSHVISFVVENQETYNQFNEKLHPGMP